MFSMDLYNEGVEIGIEQGQHILLVKLLNKKLGNISNKYLYKLEVLENSKIITIALDIFNIKTFEDLDKYLI